MQLQAYIENAALCQRRGHRGPFTDRERYDAVPGWEGLGTCATCGSTVKVDRHERRRRGREQAARVAPLGNARS